MEKKPRRWPHLTVQSVLCALVLLLALLLRAVGGEAFVQLRELVREYMTDTLLAWWPYA